jgi:hypothetical protein
MRNVDGLVSGGPRLSASWFEPEADADAAGRDLIALAARAHFDRRRPAPTASTHGRACDGPLERGRRRDLAPPCSSSGGVPAGQELLFAWNLAAVISITRASRS